MLEVIRLPDVRCVICGADTHPLAYACTRCKLILGRVEARPNRRIDPGARLRALRESWREGAFRCAYTGVALITDSNRSRDHRYLVFDHGTPDYESSVVVVCNLVNRMKTDLTD